MKYKAVLFDLDGTLLNTLEDLTDGVNYVLANNNFPKRTISEIRAFVGNGIYKLIERSLPSGASYEVIEKCYTEFSAYYKENMMNKTRPYDGIDALLAKLKKNNIKTAVVTNKAEFAAKGLCSEMFGDKIDAVVGSDRTRPNKPEPDSVFIALELIGIDKKDSVYIGDSEVDAQTAEAADMDFIAALWGFRTVRAFAEYSPKLFVKDAYELEKILLSD